MVKRWWLWSGLAVIGPTVIAFAVQGCDTAVIVPDGDGGNSGIGGESVVATYVTVTTSEADAGQDALPDVTDPPCENPPPPIQDFQCDPYHQNNGDCLANEGCYIYVQYPEEKCGQEVYGSFCVPAGTGQQGDECFGGNECAAGLDCVVTGSGTQCVTLCPLEGDDHCPPGFVCEPIDVDGFGGCL
jgi:hypothetical protein